MRSRKEIKMKKLKIVFVVVFVVVILCASQIMAFAADSKYKVAMALPGLITDEAFNQYTYEGALRACKEFGYEFAYREEVRQDEQIEILRQFAQQGYNIIIGQGGQFGEALQIVAKEFPELNFVFSVATDTGGLPNLTAATISYSQAGYLAGVQACSVTKTNKVAMIIGEWYDPHKQMYDSYIKGAQTCGKEVEVKAVTTGSWSDVNKAREASLSLIASGYDVLMPCLDAAYVGVLTAAQDSKNVLVVGTVSDMVKVAPDVVVSSIVYNWEELGYQEAAGKLLDGGSHVLGMAENGLKVVKNADLISKEASDNLDKAVEDLKAGKVDIAP